MTKINTLSFSSPGGNQFISYRDRPANATGEGLPTILYLGGFASNMNGTKAGILNEFCTQMGLRFVSFDYRGHGESFGEFTRFGIDDWVDDAILVLDKVISGQVILIGSSMGGWIAAALAKKRSERIDGFIGIAAAPDFTEQDFGAKLNAHQLELIGKRWNS